MLSSHPALTMAQSKAVAEAFDTDPGARTPQAMKDTTATAVTVKTIRSSPKRLRWSSTSMPRTRPGCRSWGYSGWGGTVAHLSAARFQAVRQ